MNRVEKEISEMSDAELAVVCGGDEPARWVPEPSRGAIAVAIQKGSVVIDDQKYIHVEDHDLDDQLVAPQEIIKGMLRMFGESPERGGLLETPARAVKAWAHWTKGYDEDPAAILKVFEDGAENYDEMVLVNNIPIYSHCEHHLAPIFGTATIAYIPSDKIVGLSKLSRVADIFARRLQVQERLTTQIMECLWDNLNPLGVAVWIKARHMCMESRGICQQGQFTITQSFGGVMKDGALHWRREFLEQCR